MRQVTQKSVHLKLNYVIDAWLDKWTFTEGRPKNRLINDACALYVRLLEAKARYGAVGKRAEFADLCNKLFIDPTLKDITL